MKVSRFHFSLLKQTSAWIPLAISLATLGLVLGHALVYGIVREADDGAAPIHRRY